MSNLENLAMGFCCQTASTLSSQEDLTHSCITDAEGSTGVTFYSVMLNLMKHKPASCSLENVGGLMRGDQHEAVAKQLSRAG